MTRIKPIITPDEAAKLIRNGWHIASAGFVGAGHAEAISSAIEARFLQEQQPKDLTLIYSAGQGDRGDRGVNHFGQPGLTQRIIGGHWRSATKLAALALAEQTEAFNLPQGVITHLYRAIASGQAGVLTKIGLYTFVDPRLAGGRVNTRRTVGEELVSLVNVLGEDYLFYRTIPIHCTLLRATVADPQGNLTCEDEAFHHELLAIAQAARNSGGIVIAQVKRVSNTPADPDRVRVPGILVDYLVPVGDDPQLHAMTFAEVDNPTYKQAAPHVATHHRVGLSLRQGGMFPVAKLDTRTIIQRRAALEIADQTSLNRPMVVNLGVGMPAGVGAIAQAGGVDDFVLTVESGPIGGTPADGLSFGASQYPQAIIDQPAQFDFYNGGGIDLAVLGIGEFDRQGNVNVSLFGEASERLLAGVGGFINISQSTKRLVFIGSFSAGGLSVAVNDGQVQIANEGRQCKLREQVSHLSFNAGYALSRGASLTYITERAVFVCNRVDDLNHELVLTEIAPGIEVDRDVRQHLPFRLRVASNLKLMDSRIFM